MANIMTAKELENYLKLSKSTIYKLASTGAIPGFRIGDSWRFDMNDILKLIRRRKKGGKEYPDPTFAPNAIQQDLES